MYSEFESLTTDEKVKFIRTSDEYNNRMNPLHTRAVRYMVELSATATPAAYQPDLPDDIGGLLKTDAMKSRVHPDHQAAFRKFQKLHGL